MILNSYQLLQLTIVAELSPQRLSMQPSVIKRRSHFQKEIRAKQIQNKFSSVREIMVNKQIYNWFRDTYQGLISHNEINPHQLVHNIMEEFSKSTNNDYGPLSEATSSILMANFGFFMNQPSDYILPLFQTILPQLSKQSKKQLACSQYQCWLYNNFLNSQEKCRKYCQIIVELARLSDTNTKQNLKINEKVIEKTIMEADFSAKALTLLLVTLIHTDSSQLTSIMIKKLLRMARSLNNQLQQSATINLQDKNICNSIIFQIFCMISLEESDYHILQKLLQRCQNGGQSVENILIFISKQAELTSWVDYPLFRRLLLQLRDKFSRSSHWIQTFNILGCLLINNKLHSHQIYKQMIQNHLESFVTRQLIIFLAQLLSKLFNAKLIMDNYNANIVIKCLQIGNTSIEQHVRMNLLKNLVNNRYFDINQTREFLFTQEEKENFWMQIEIGVQDQQIEENFSL